MSSELLERATRALRASSAHAGESDARLERALERLRRAERVPARSPWRLRTTAWTLAATLAGAGAWAHATGKVQWFASAPEPAEPVAPAARGAREARRAPAVVAAPDVPLALPAELEAPAPVPAEPVPSEVRAPKAPKPKLEVQPAAPPVAALPQPQGADELYREAHAAHFTQRDYDAALAAWERYLAAAGPAHRWTVEARFNRGVALFRLGQREAARRALRPFAEGEYGSYRRAEAASLLEALRSAP